MEKLKSAVILMFLLFGLGIFTIAADALLLQWAWGLYAVRHFGAAPLSFAQALSMCLALWYVVAYLPNKTRPDDEETLVTAGRAIGGWVGRFFVVWGWLWLMSKIWL